jgi:TP901 family phage tail tape measure protein
MARLSSDLVLTLHDKVTGAAKQIDLSLDKLQRRQGAFGNSMVATNGATMKAGAALGMYARNAAMATAPFAAAFGAKEVVVAAATFESALTNIQKKANTTAEQTRQLGDDIKDLATNGKLASPIEDIAAAYERGAAAGIPLDDLKTFATLSAKAADAFEMSATDVGNASAGFSTVLQIPMDQMERYFDLINGLADAGIADESGIVNYLDRAGSMAKTFGLSAEETAAFGAALANLKVPAEKAATATNSIFTKLLAPNALSKNAREAYFTLIKDDKKFAKQLATGKSAEAFVGMLESLKALKAEARAGLAADLFGQEHVDTVLQMVEGIDEVKRNLNFAGDQSKWFGSLDKSYQLKLDDMMSQWQLFQNNLKRLTIDLGTLILPPGKDFLSDASAALQGLDATIKGVTTSYNILSSALTGNSNKPGDFDPKSWTDFWPDIVNKKRQDANAKAAETEKTLAGKSPRSGAVSMQASRNMDGVLTATVVAGLRNTVRKLTADTPGEQNDRREFIRKQQPIEQYDPGSGIAYRDWLQQKHARDEAAAEAAKLPPMQLPTQSEFDRKTDRVPVPSARPDRVVAVPTPRPAVVVVDSVAPEPRLSQAVKPVAYEPLRPSVNPYADTPVVTASTFAAPQAAAPAAPPPPAVSPRTAPLVSAREAESFSIAALVSQFSALLDRAGSFQKGTTGADVTDEAGITVDTAAMDAAKMKAAETGAAIQTSLAVTATPNVVTTSISAARREVDALVSSLQRIPGLAAAASSAAAGAASAGASRVDYDGLHADLNQ